MEFTGENVPIAVVAKVMKKDPQYVRLCIQRGIFPFGVAVKVKGNYSDCKYSYYVSPKLFYEYTGYVYKGSES